ncbi:MAG: hypothetical protein COT81_03365 [Candidatus Buchananbacteria bacterium CG10_big_fil_rev_8_21_14_0_10_42_9]|uniref:Uncharacterized protein n=1 Tax=Candidatus Buchananbacteria bacterium CG10_big_fil_rev_8_21_14_0_10_42_9 TaxID=1974526 RepID=A0A2H0W0W0_9BACT|nr:MAG: hypothetical protein COT81_03365 [Candidatus Buchananbacteria bacterium CG10_big_fil_rev_8_21_14_0_10_42_9]
MTDHESPSWASLDSNGNKLVDCPGCGTPTPSWLLQFNIPEIKSKVCNRCYQNPGLRRLVEPNDLRQAKPCPGCGTELPKGYLFHYLPDFRVKVCYECKYHPERRTRLNATLKEVEQLTVSVRPTKRRGPKMDKSPYVCRHCPEGKRLKQGPIRFLLPGPEWLEPVCGIHYRAYLRHTGRLIVALRQAALVKAGVIKRHTADSVQLPGSSPKPQCRRCGKPRKRRLVYLLPGEEHLPPVCKSCLNEAMEPAAAPKPLRRARTESVVMRHTPGVCSRCGKKRDTPHDWPGNPGLYICEFCHDTLPFGVKRNVVKFECRALDQAPEPEPPKPRKRYKVVKKGVKKPPVEINDDDWAEEKIEKELRDPATVKSLHQIRQERGEKEVADEKGIAPTFEPLVARFNPNPKGG